MIPSSTQPRVTTALLFAVLCAAGLSSSDAAETRATLEQRLEKALAENSELRRELQKMQKAAPPVQNTPESPDASLSREDSDRRERLEPFATVLDRVVLRQSVFDEKIFKNPAQVTYVRPGSGPATYAIDAGLGFNFITYQRGKMQLDWFLGADYHRNSNPTALSDLFQAGVIFDLVLGNVAEDRFTSMLKGVANFKNDTVVDVQSVEGSLEFLPLWSPLRINSALRAGPLMAQWQPFAGIVYESATDTAANIETGHRALARFGAEVEVFPLATILKDRLRLFARYTAWSTLDASGLYETPVRDEWSTYFEAGVSYYFLVDTPAGGSQTAKQTRIGIGLTYTNGDQPELGLKEVDQLTLSLQAQF